MIWKFNQPCLLDHVRVQCMLYGDQDSSPLGVGYPAAMISRVHTQSWNHVWKHKKQLNHVNDAYSLLNLTFYTKRFSIVAIFWVQYGSVASRMSQDNSSLIVLLHRRLIIVLVYVTFVLHCIISYCMIPYYTTLYCIKFGCTVLYHFIFYDI